jgi:hypothetical protein
MNPTVTSVKPSIQPETVKIKLEYNCVFGINHVLARLNSIWLSNSVDNILVTDMFLDDINPIMISERLCKIMHA